MSQRTAALKPKKRPILLCVEKPRRTIRFTRPVYVRVAGETLPAEPLRAATLSKAGMYIRSSAPPSEGTFVELFLEASGRRLRFGEGRVSVSVSASEASAHGGLAGFLVDFERLPPRSQALVHWLIQLCEGKVANTNADADADTGASTGARARKVHEVVTGAARWVMATIGRASVPPRTTAE